MNLNDFINAIQVTIAVGGLTAPVWFPIVRATWKLIEAKVEANKGLAKNENVKLFMGWADQAVAQMAKATDYTNPQKKAAAVNYVTERLQDNKLTNKFSDEQISAIIEMAVNKLNETGTNDPAKALANLSAEFNTEDK